jgi:retinol dehydrogenase-12
VNRDPFPASTIDGKLCLVTGATSGIGAAAAPELARRGAHVLIHARDAGRGRATATAIIASHPDAQLEVLSADLARMDDVRRLAGTVEDTHGRLDVLINNAGVVNFTRRTTPDGHEHTLAVNHLAPFLLTHLLRPALSVPDEARVLSITSDHHKSVTAIPWQDMNTERDYKPLHVYNRTKLMNVWFTQILAETLAGSGITANCLSPGFVKTNLARDATGAFRTFIRLAAPFQSTPQTAAKAITHLAGSPQLSGQSGGYYVKAVRTQPGGLADDHDAALCLWRLSAELTGVTT